MVNWMHAGEVLWFSDNSLSWKDQSYLCMMSLLSMMSMPNVMSNFKQQASAEKMPSDSPAGNSLRPPAPAQPASQQQALLGRHADCCLPHLAPALQ